MSPLDLPNLLSLTIGNYAFRFALLFYITNLNLLQVLEIGDGCFINVVTFELNGLNNLEKVNIGKDSFTLIGTSEYNDDYDVLKNADNEYRSFHIVNCKSLESISIDQFSFCDYAGQFELRNLPMLQKVAIGKWGAPSYNFYRSSLIVRGIHSYLS